ncbi:uncharacterized protein LOC112559426 [Pomacea canaliculata]|uniref:uncharacterized protein LOC112559426 n=1 Tax=Pomacea canaliculata TaxID=400727 RepID=UPI000D7375A3|nr:uncharacterized protein LOC112559426 [Pomacea canaliculata]
MSQSAAKTVLQNIFTFATIVAQAETPAVTLWNEESVIRALQWASYCRQLADRLCGRQLAITLEERLKEMSHLMDNHFLYNLDLQFLAQSVTILIEALVHNPHLPENLLLTLRKTLEKQYSSYVSVLQQCLTASRSELQFSTAVTVHMNILKDRMKSCTVSHDDPMVKEHGRLLMENLTLWMEADGSERCKIQIVKIAKRLSWCSTGWNILLMLMAIDMSKIEESKKNHLGHVINVIVSWFTEETRALGPACPLWRADPVLLASVAQRCTCFCEFYLSALEQQMELLEVSYSSQSTCLQYPKECSYFWRSREKPDIPLYAVILQHFLHLLQTEDGVVKKKALALVSLKTKCCVFSAWTDLAKDLIRNLAY